MTDFQKNCAVWGGFAVVLVACDGTAGTPNDRYVTIF